jgi:hypothetical protein
MLLKQQLASGPKDGATILEQVEGHEISERSLMAAADALGVRCQNGEWRLPG